MALLNANQINSGASLPYASERFAHVRGSEGVLSYRHCPGIAANTDVVLGDEDGRLSHWAIIVSGGSGYTSAPNVAVGAPAATGVQAVATAGFANGKVTGVQFTNRGTKYDYYNPPKLTITGGGGSGAEAIAVVESPDFDNEAEVVYMFLLPRRQH